MAGAAEIRAGRAFVELYLKNNLTKGLANVRKQLDGFSKSAIAAGQKLAAMGTMAAVPFAMATKRFMDFDDAMRLVGAVSQSTDKELAMLTATAKRLGATTSFTAVQVASLMGELGRAGFSAEQVNVMTGAVLNLARATGTDATLSAGIMAASIRQFGLGASDATRVADLLTVAANASFNSVESLGEALSYAGPVAADFNMSMEDTLAILGALGNVGIQGSNAGTALRRLLTITGAEAEKLKEIFGVTFVDAAGNARPLVDVLDEVNKATANLGTADRAKKFNEAFGLLGITGASAIAKNAVSVRDLQKQLQNAGGVAEQTAKKMDGGLGGAFRMMMSAIEGVAISIGEALAPMLSNLAKQIEMAAGATIKFIDSNKELVTIAALAVGGVVAVGAGLIAAGIAAKVLGFGIGMASRALAPAIVGAGLLRGGLAKLQGAAVGVGKAARTMGPAMLSGVTQALGHLSRIGTGGGQVAVGFAQIGKAAATSIAAGLVSAGPSIAAGLRTAFRSGMAGVSAIAAEVGPRIADAFAPLGARIAARFGPPIKNAWKETVLTVQEVAEGYVRSFSQVSARISAAIGPPLRKALNGLTTTAQTVSGGLSKVFGPVGAKISATLGPPVRRAFIELTFAGMAAAEKIRAAWRATAPVIASNLVRVMRGAFNGVRAMGIGTAKAIAAGAGSIGRGFGNIAGGLGSLAMLFGGAGGGMLGSLLMAAPLVMSLVNPLTIIVGLIGAAAFAWINFSDGGKKAFAGVMSVLNPFIETAKKGWGGIADAMKQGDFAGAAKIAFATLKVIALDAFASVANSAKPLTDVLIGVWDVAAAFWHTAVDGLKAAWQTFADFFSGSSMDMGDGWSEFAEGIVAVFTQAARAVAGIWQSTVSGLAKMMVRNKAITGIDVEQKQREFTEAHQKDIELEKGFIARTESQRARAAKGDFTGLDLSEELEGKVRAGTATQEEILADLDEQIKKHRRNLRNLESENTDLLSQADAAIEADIAEQASKFLARLDSIDRRAQERTQAEDSQWAQDAASKARDELDALLRKKKVADEEVKKKASEIDAIANGTADAIKGGAGGSGGAAGTFSAAALGLLGRGGVQQKQLEELKKQTKLEHDKFKVDEKILAELQKPKFQLADLP